MACAQAFLDSMVARNDDLDTLRTRTTLLTTGWRSSESEALEYPRSQSLDSAMQFRVGAAPAPFLFTIPSARLCTYSYSAQIFILS